MWVVLSLLIALIGFVLMLTQDPKPWKEIGQTLLLCGLLAFLLQFGPKAVGLLSGKT